MNRVFLAEPNSILRSALALLLETRLGAQIVGQVGNTESLLREIALTQPDLIIMDWELPGGPAAERIAILRRMIPDASILITSLHPEYSALTGGADAFICKNEPPEAILLTIQNVALNVARRSIHHV